MPVFSIMAIKSVPLQAPQNPLEEIIVEPITIVAADRERAKLHLARLIPEGVDLNLVKTAVVPIQVE